MEQISAWSASVGPSVCPYRNWRGVYGERSCWAVPTLHSKSESVLKWICRAGLNTTAYNCICSWQVLMTGWSWLELFVRERFHFQGHNASLLAAYEAASQQSLQQQWKAIPPVGNGTALDFPEWSNWNKWSGTSRWNPAKGYDPKGDMKSRVHGNSSVIPRVNKEYMHPLAASCLTASWSLCPPPLDQAGPRTWYMLSRPYMCVFIGSIFVAVYCSVHWFVGFTLMNAAVLSQERPVVQSKPKIKSSSSLCELYSVDFCDS